MKLLCKVLYHGNCFDGACSAALFTRFHRECIGTADAFRYQAMMHRAGPAYDDSSFLPESSAGENAIVDFKYSRSPRVTWWFDHHQSAFTTAEDEAHFRATQRDGSTSQRQFFDPASISCTGLIAHIASTRFAMDIRPFAELIHWADIVDGARYESATAAVEMRAPAMQLTALIESAPTSDLVERIIPLLTELPLQQVLDQPFVQERIAPLMATHHTAIELLRQRITCDHGVIRFDITDQPTEGYNKFIPYYLHPGATYHVGLSRSSFRNKISVGTNPWTTRPAAELANIAAICERFGGGGHVRVGAISFPVDQAAEAQAASQIVAAELSSQGST